MPEEHEDSVRYRSSPQMIKLTTFRKRARRHLLKRRRLNKARNCWAWFAKLYSVEKECRQFRFVEEMEAINKEKENDKH